MRMSRMLMVVCMVGALIAACSEKQPATIGQAQPGSSSQQAPSVAQVEQTAAQVPPAGTTMAEHEPVEIGGTLMQTEKGLAVVTDTQTYVVAGKDLTGMLGKTVTVTGAIAEVDGSQVINVMTVTPLE